MGRLRWWVAALLWVALLAAGGVVQARSLAEALRAEPVLVVAIVPTVGRAVRGSEAFGDWESYLAAYEQQAGAAPVVRTSPAEWQRVVRLPQLKRGFATLFIRRGDAGVVLEGMALEPAIYGFGAGFLADGKLDPAAGPYGLRRETVRLRE